MVFQEHISGMLMQPGMGSAGFIYYSKTLTSFSTCRAQLFNFVITNKSISPNIDFEKSQKQQEEVN